MTSSLYCRSLAAVREALVRMMLKPRTTLGQLLSFLTFDRVIIIIRIMCLVFISQQVTQLGGEMRKAAPCSVVLHTVCL